MNWRNEMPSELLDRIRNARVVGMGGAGYPTHKKLRIALQSKTRMLIANGVETDPGVTADQTLLATRGADVLEGIQIVARILGATFCSLAVADSNLASRLSEIASAGVSVNVVEDSYQSGEERVLIETLTGKSISADIYPAQEGIVVLNVATLHAICRCVRDGVPPNQRIVTVLGCDEWHPIGTPIRSIVPHVEHIRIGSSATGWKASESASLKATHNAVSADHSTDSLACIGCGWCTEACPKNLPVEQMYDDAVDSSRSPQLSHLNDCNECGACVVACPSRIHLLDFIRESRSKRLAVSLRKEKAQRARERFDAKQQRVLNRSRHDQDERERRMRKDHQWL